MRWRIPGPTHPESSLSVALRAGTIDRAVNVERIEAVLKLAREATCSRTGLRELAERVADHAEVLEAAVRATHASLEGTVGAMLAMAASTVGLRIQINDVTPLFPFVANPTWIPILVGGTVGARPRALVQVVESGQLSTEREALVLFLATELLDAEKPPPQLVACLRTMARRTVSATAGVFLGLAAKALNDPDTQNVARHWIALASNSGGQRVRARMRELLDGPAVAVLTEGDPEAGSPDEVPVRRVAEKVGRNDPCPCGSGRKFKKCCEGKGAAVAPQRASITAGELDRSTSTPSRNVTELSIRDVARLDFSTLPTRELIDAMRTLADHRLWEAAEKTLEVMASRRDIPGGETVDGHRSDLLSYAIEARAVDVVERQMKLLKDPKIAAEHALGLALMKPDGTTLQVLELHARTALRNPRGTGAVSLAHELLESAFSGLGIFVGRGAVLTAGALDAETLLETLEESRDRLQLPPGDIAATVYESMLDRQIDSKMAESRNNLASEETDRLIASTESLRENLRRTTERVRALEAQLLSQDALSAPSEVRSENDREKIRELKALVTAGNEERAGLRRQLAELAERSKSEPAGSSKSDLSKGEDEEQHEEDVSESPRHKTLIPTFTDKASTAIAGGPRVVTGQAVEIVGRLAAGVASAWAGIKRLRARADVFSVRIGLHYRLLFTVDVGRGRLEVLAFVHRKDLENGDPTAVSGEARGPANAY